ncbi:alcohol dehydrogenase catalytic domain-containing protein [Kocuria sp. NPDC057446]|uniref:alcohol dehydrogenase catalytic domain-containing protein n=1 Tax=Kocuria sp. NPDC057446 TaxID=3346137 RepID=UPI0036C1389D
MKALVSQAVVAERFGPPQQVLNLTKLVHPEPLPHQVIVRMTAVALNPSDLIPVRGAYPHRTPLPFIPGFEGVGVITSLGEHCPGWTLGQRVMPVGTAGAWQTLRVVNASQCIPVPSDVPDSTAARSYINPITAHHMVQRYAGGAATVALNASSSSIAVILAHLLHQQGIQVVELGSRSTGTADSLFLDTAGDDWMRNVRDLGQQQVIDLAFDCVGGTEGEWLAQAVRVGERWCTMACCRVDLCRSVCSSIARI